MIARFIIARFNITRFNITRFIITRFNIARFIAVQFMIGANTRQGEYKIRPYDIKPGIPVTPYLTVCRKSTN